MFTSYQKALDYIYSLTMTSTHRIFGHIGLERVKCLLSLIDNPQDKLNIIHIAGTSGKGGTSYILSQLLQKVTKQNVWLHVSPHLIDLRERIQINGQLVEQEVFIEALNILYPAIQTVSDSFFWAPSYYETTTSLMYLIFAMKQVDYAIVEVWCGGLYDGTNVSEKSKYCIITKQWYDHMEIVGESMTEITRNDAGIITPWSTIITLDHEIETCNEIIDYRCKKQNAKKILFDMNTNLKNIEYQSDKTSFEYNHKLPTFNFSLSTNLVGPFHLENLWLALTAFLTITEQEKLLPRNTAGQESQLETVLENLHRAGRFDSIQYNNKSLLLDGAHNVQKMQALLDTLLICYLRQTFTFYVSFKQGKQRQEMLDLIIPYAEEIIIGDFMITQDFRLHSVAPHDILAYLQSKGFEQASIDTDIIHVIEHHTWSPDQPLVITGSLYFLSTIYPMIQGK